LSLTVHALLIGAISKIMDSVVLNKKWGVCSKHISSIGEIQGVMKHSCIEKCEGSLKSMEAAALTTMLTCMPKEKDLSICTIISDNDSIAGLNQEIKRKGGELSDSIEEPTFLADPS
jgi:hypothetical protein